MLLKLAWRNIWRNKKRSYITISAIAIAVLLSVCMRSMQLGMYDNMISKVVGSYSGYLQIHSKGYWEEQIIDNSFTFNNDILDEIYKTDGVNNIVPRIQNGALVSNEKDSKFVFITGINSNKEKLLTNWDKRLIKGDLLEEGSKSINIGKGIASFFNLDIGDTLIFIGQGYHGMQAVGAFPVSGIIDLKNPKLNNISVFMSLNTAQKFLSAENQITHLIIDKKEYSDELIIAKNIKSNLGKDYEVMTWQEMMPELEQTIKADSVGGLIMVFILYMIITFGIFGTVLMMTQERKYEFGVVISIGMKKLFLIITMIYESILLTSIGIIFGILISRPIILYYHYNPLEFTGESAKAFEDFGFEAIVPFMSTFDIPITHGLIIFFISLIICLYPIIYILKLTPIKAMKG